MWKKRNVKIKNINRCDKKMKEKITNKKLDPFKKYGFTIRTLRTSLKSSKGTTHAYEFSIYKGRTWIGIENFQAENMSSAKKKLMRELRKQKYKKL